MTAPATASTASATMPALDLSWIYRSEAFAEDLGDAYPPVLPYLVEPVSQPALN